MTPEQAVDTYDMTIKNYEPHEYPGWVTEVRRCLLDDSEPDERYPAWVAETLGILRERNDVSFSDSN